MTGHRAHTMYVGVHLPSTNPTKRRSHHRRHRRHQHHQPGIAEEGSVTDKGITANLGVVKPHLLIGSLNSVNNRSDPAFPARPVHFGGGGGWRWSDSRVASSLLRDGRTLLQSRSWWSGMGWNCTVIYFHLCCLAIYSTQLFHHSKLTLNLRSIKTLHWIANFRWVKFEEDVEEGGSRWSKPHVATLSLHALFELRSLLLNGVVLLDADAQTLVSITDLAIDAMAATGHLPFNSRDRVRRLCDIFMHEQCRTAPSPPHFHA